MYIFKHSNDFDKMFEAMPFTCGYCLMLLKFICLAYNFKEVNNISLRVKFASLFLRILFQFKALLQLTQENWNTLPKSQEMQIMIHYAEIGRKFMNAYICTDCTVDTTV